VEQGRSYNRPQPGKRSKARRWRKGPECVPGSNVLREVKVLLALGWRAPYPKAGVMPRWPQCAWLGRAGCPPRGGIRRACGEAPGRNRWGDPTMNRSAKEGVWSSRHSGDEGVIHPPLGPRCVRAARCGRACGDPGRSHRRPVAQGAGREGAPISREAKWAPGAGERSEDGIVPEARARKPA